MIIIANHPRREYQQFQKEHEDVWGDSDNVVQSGLDKAENRKSGLRSRMSLKVGFKQERLFHLRMLY